MVRQRTNRKSKGLIKLEKKCQKSLSYKSTNIIKGYYINNLSLQVSDFSNCTNSLRPNDLAQRDVQKIN